MTAIGRCRNSSVFRYVTDERAKFPYAYQKASSLVLAFVLVQHHQGQVRVARLLAQLRAIGIDVSKRQVMLLLIAGQDGFIDEARDVLRAGLTNAARCRRRWPSDRLATPIWLRAVHREGAHHTGNYRICESTALDMLPASSQAWRPQGCAACRRQTDVRRSSARDGVTCRPDTSVLVLVV